MSLTLYYHPLASFCQKVLIGLYELDVPFEKLLVDLNDPAERAAFLKVWPIGKFPVLRDDAHNVTLPESSVILEHAATHYAPGSSLIPDDPARAQECRLRDRFFDLYVNTPTAKIVTDKLRAEGKHDPYGVEQAREQLEIAYAVADDWLRAGPWAAGETFSLADCAAAPALFYADKVLPFQGTRRYLSEYFARLSECPSFARVIAEAQPYWSLFPG
jgi:glutathione S-transferase